jgi:hypothetical protein
MADAPPAQGLSKTPADFLKSIKGKPVIVKLNSGVDYRGRPALGGGAHSAVTKQHQTAACALQRKRKHPAVTPPLKPLEIKRQASWRASTAT